MMCPDCHGTGSVRYEWNPRARAWITGPCPECNGSGIASCCDTAGSATGDERPKCHPLLFGEPG